jgi:hypothetical protein
MISRYCQITTDHHGAVSDVIHPGMKMVSNRTVLGTVIESDAFGAKVKFIIRGILFCYLNRKNWATVT